MASQTKNYTVRTRQLRQYQRRIFQDVMENVNNIRSTMGQIKTDDLSNNTGGQGTQYKMNGVIDMFSLIDYTVDVLNAVEKELSKAEWKAFQAEILDQPLNLTVQSESFMEIQERLGRIFLGMGFYPAKKYFAQTKS